jgi:hypothetical protein
MDRNDERQLVSLLRGRIDRENDLLSQRTTWVVTSQAFLFSAYAICLSGGAHTPVGPMRRSIDLLATLVPWTGIISIALLYMTIFGGMRAVARVRRLFHPSGSVERAVLRTDRTARLLGLAAPLGIPGVFLITWVTLLAAHGPEPAWRDDHAYDGNAAATCDGMRPLVGDDRPAKPMYGAQSLVR